MASVSILLDKDWNSDNEAAEDHTLLPQIEALSVLAPTSSPGQFGVSVILILLVTNLLSILITYFGTTRHDREAYSMDIDGTSKLFPGLDRSLTWKTFSDHHLNVTSRWSSSPSKEVDQAWNELGVKDQFILVPGSIGRAHGLDPRKHVYAPESVAGPGKEGFGAFVQGLHDLHCLNELRRALYFNKDYYRQFEDDALTPEYVRQSHIRHCLDNVRERLMCTADAGIIPSVWVSREENYPLFGMSHKCHSYQAMMEWFRSWHEANDGGLVWTGHVKAPPDAIFTEI